MQLKQLVDYIGSLLEVARFRDYCPNGLQVEGRPEVLKIATGVSASQQVLETAAEWGADVILVHHGYFWRGEDAAITGIKKRRIAYLLNRDISLLAYHLPLDAHARFGNNAQLAQRLGWREDGRFGEQEIASYGLLENPIPLNLLSNHISEVLQRMPLVVGEGGQSIARIAWCSGGAQGYFEQAIGLGVQAFVTGEISEQHVHLARESGVAFIAAGHHATERYGVMALGEHLAAQFGITWRHIEENNPV